MKACLCTVGLAVLAVVSLSARSLSTSCVMTADSQQTSCEQVARHLIQGTWTADLPVAQDDKADLILQFGPAGKLDLMERQPVGHYTHQQFSWTVEAREDRLQLLLRDGSSGAMHLYDLVKTVGGLALTEVSTGKRVDLNFHPRAAARDLKEVQEMLAGEWANSLYPFELSRSGNERMAGAFLYYRFLADGTYSKSLGNSEAQIDETGQWEISADGRYLLLHTQAYDRGKRITKTTAARIKFVRYDEMVLEHALEVENERFCTELKDFYFSRI